MKRFILLIALFSCLVYGKDFNITLQGSDKKENITVRVPFDVDEKGKVIPFQKVSIPKAGKIKNLMVISAPGLKGTMIDEREVIVFYKTSLEVSGMMIRNLYKIGVGRLYYDENNLTINMDNDYYQNIYSFLQYHNIKREQVKDLDNIYGSWLIVSALKINNQN